MRRLVTAFLFCGLLAPPVLAQNAPVDPGKLALKDYAKTAQGRYAYGIYIQGKKIGWSISDTKLGKYDGKDALIVTEEGMFEIRRGQDALKMESKSKCVFGLEGSGGLLMQEESTKEGKKLVTRRGVRKGDTFVITSSTNGGGKSERQTGIPKKQLKDSQRLEVWLRGNPKPGDKFETFGLSLEDRDLNTKEVYTFKSKREATVGGIKDTLYKVKHLSKGAVSDAEMKGDGTPLTEALGGLLVTRMEPEKTVRNLDKSELDLLTLVAIPVDRDLGDPRTVASLTLKVEGLDDYPLPTSARQVLKKGDKKGEHILELKRDFKTEKPEPLTEKQRKELTEATPTVQSDLPKLRELAKKVVGDEKDPAKKAAHIRQYVYRNLKKTLAANSTTTSEILETMAGDCTEHALLFVSMARAAGLPAREVGGVGFASVDGKTLFGWHAWGEYHDGHQWVAVDPTWNEARVDATHVKFSNDGEDLAWINVLGKVKFKVVDVKRRESK
jgi:hypothetical protein